MSTHLRPINLWIASLVVMMTDRTFNGCYTSDIWMDRTLSQDEEGERFLLVSDSGLTGVVVNASCTLDFKVEDICLS